MESEKFFLTKDGLAKLQHELMQLKEVIEAKIKEDVPSSVSSELNEEYISFQEDMGQLRSRITELEIILNNYEMIDYDPKNHCQIVRIGCRVEIEKDGEKEELTIVGALEADPTLRRISNQSPIGKSLMGHRPGDEVLIRPKRIYRIKKITYGF